MRTQRQIINIMKNMLTLLIYWCKSKKRRKNMYFNSMTN